jgi:hypothetical protein
VGIAIVVAIVPLHIFGMLYLYRQYRKHARFYKEAMVAEGVVVGTREFSGGDGPDHFARIFYTVAGTEYMLRDGVWTQRRRYKRGQLVKVYYLPESPGSGRIAAPSGPVIYMGGALLIAVIVVILLATLLNELWKLQ